MPGGILQLAAQGTENAYLSDNPQITLFKTVYRRHSNFAKVEQNLTFNHKLNFGSQSTCELKHFGDLVSRLILSIELPEIKLSYITLTNEHLRTLLAKYGIVWSYSSGRGNIKITQDEYEQVVGEIAYVSFQPILPPIEPPVIDVKIVYTSEFGVTSEQADKDRLIEVLMNIVNINNYLYPISGNTLTYDEIIQLQKKINNTQVRLTNGSILDQINLLMKTIEKDDQFITEIRALTSKYESEGNTDVSQYVDELMLTLLRISRGLFESDQSYIDEYDYYNEYYYLYSYKNDYSTILPRPIVWIESGNNIIRYVDPTDGIPQSPAVTEDNRFICAVSDRGWIADKVYKFVNAAWVIGEPQLYNGNIINDGYTNMGINKLNECIGWSNLFSINGFYNPNTTRKITSELNVPYPGPPNKPSLGDTYISLEDATPTPTILWRQWKTNEMWRCTDVGTDDFNSVWEKINVPIGSSIYVRGGDVYYKRMLFKNDTGEWFELVSADKRIEIIFDGTTWRKSVKSFYDPTNGLPQNPKIGDRYICYTTINTPTLTCFKNHIYVWSGWVGWNNDADMSQMIPACRNGWLDIIPTDKYCVRVEKGNLTPDPEHPETSPVDCIASYDGLNDKWVQVDVNILMYTWQLFIKLLYLSIRNQIFTDNNIKLLYGVEYCNTTVLPNMATQQMRTFFDNITSNAIRVDTSATTNVIDESTSLWIHSYNPFFTEKDTFSGVSIGESFVGSYENLINVQSNLITRMRYFIKNEIIPDVNMFNMLFSRLNYYESGINVPSDDYYRFIYYKPYDRLYGQGSQSGQLLYNAKNLFYNCPKKIYERNIFPTTSLDNEPLQDYFLSKLERVDIPAGYLTATGYITTKILPQVETLLGKPSAYQVPIDGTLYDYIQNDSLVTSFFENFFTYTNDNVDIASKYSEVKNNILVHSNLINKNVTWLSNPNIISFYNDPASLPVGANIGDRYICNHANTYSWTLSHIYEFDGASWIESIPSNNNVAYFTNQNLDCVVEFDGLSWAPPTTISSVISEYNPTSGLPTLILGNRYLSTATANGWTSNYVYECVSVSEWMTRKYIISQYNPTAGLPVGPLFDDAYISTAAASGWLKNNIYTYDGISWIATVPQQNDEVYVKNVDTIEMFDGANWVPVSVAPTLYEHDPTINIPPMRIGIKYTSTSTANGWHINYVYEGVINLSWAPTEPLHMNTVYIGNTNSIKQFVETLWVSVSTQQQVSSYFDATGGLPPPIGGSRYICSISGNGWTKNNIYEYDTGTASWIEYVTVLDDTVYIADVSMTVTFDGSRWATFALASRSVLSYYDPTTGLPISPNVSDIYLCKTSANSWTKDMMYEFNGLNWIEIPPRQYETIYVKDTHVLLQFSGTWILQEDDITSTGVQTIPSVSSVIKQYDPSGGLPVTPNIGDSYVSMFTANTWLINYIYKWDGSVWHETIPVPGQLVYMTDPLFNTVRMYISGVGYSWALFTNGKIYTPASDKVREFNGTEWVILPNVQMAIREYDPVGGLPVAPSTGDCYVSMSTANTWVVNHIYKWNGSLWGDTTPAIGDLVYLSDILFDTVLTYNGGIGYNWISFTPPVKFRVFTPYDTDMREYDGSSWNIVNSVFYISGENIVRMYSYQNSWTPTKPFNNDKIYDPYQSIDSTRIFGGTWGELICNPKYDVYNICNCLNLLASPINPTASQPSFGDILNDQIFYTYRRFFYNLRAPTSLGNAKGSDWGEQLNNIINYIHLHIRTLITSMTIPNYVWDGFNGNGANAIYDVVQSNPNNIMSLFIFKYYTIYDIHKFLPSNIEQIVPDSYFASDEFKNKNAIEFLALTYQKNLEAYIENGFNLGTQVLTSSEKNALQFKIRRISCAYTGATEVYNSEIYVGLKTFEQYVANNHSNISQSDVPELYYSGIVGLVDYDNTPDNFTPVPVNDLEWYDPETSRSYFRKHRPYDIVTAVTCYVINLMKVSYDSFYTNSNDGVMLPATYNAMGNPFTNAIALIPDSFSGDYYVDGNELYANIISLMNDNFSLFVDGLKMYYSYQKLLNIKNMGVNNAQYKYASTLEMLIQFHKEVYNNQGYYVGGNLQAYVEIFGSPAPDITYVSAYNDVILGCLKNLEPLLAFYNIGNGIYASPIDIMYLSSHNRMVYTLENPYDVDVNKIVMPSVISLYTSVNPPVSPTIGDRYISFGSTSGWVLNNVYQWNGTIWESHTPSIGEQRYVTNLNSSVRFVLVIPTSQAAWQTAWNDSNVWYDETVISNIDSILNLEKIGTDPYDLFSPNGIGIFEYFTRKIESSVNPFANGTNLYDWYNGLVQAKKQTEIDKMYKLFDLPYSRQPIGSPSISNVYAITPLSLYNDEGTINADYDSFLSNKNFLAYLMDHILKFSSVGNTTSLVKSTITETNIAFVGYYQKEKNDSIKMIDNISQYTVGYTYASSSSSNAVAKGIPYMRTKLGDRIGYMYVGNNPRFAWIQEIGHYIIEYINFNIGDEKIDFHTGEFMHVKMALEQKSDTSKGYDKMIGNVAELYTFNNTQKQKYKMFIPLQNTFCEKYQSSLPLVCLNNTNVSVTVKLRDLSDVAYWDTETIFTKRPQLNCNVIADFILLDMDERKTMATQKQEMLYETVQYNGDIFVNLSEITKMPDYETYRDIKSFYDPSDGLPSFPVVGDAYVSSKIANGWYEKFIYEWDGHKWNSYGPNIGDRIILTDSNTDPKQLMTFSGTQWVNVEEPLFVPYHLRLGFVGLSKELIFVVQTKEKIDGTLPNGEKKWNDYLVDLSVDQTSENVAGVNPIYDVEVRFNGREREGKKHIKYYNLVQRYKHHTASSYDGINVYSFALEPEMLQPSGCANFSKIDNIDLYITFMPQFARFIDANRKIVRIGVYNRSCNILRIMSGMAGMAFYP